MNSGPQVYFSLGEALALVSIFIAVYQLMSPTWRMIWTINGRFRTSVLWLAAIGYTMPFAAIFFEHPIHIHGMAIGSEQFQAAGFVFLTFSFIDFARLMFSQKGKLLNAKSKVGFLKARNIDLFYEKVSQRILLEDYKTATDLLSDNIYELISLASEHRSENPEKKKVPHHSEFAREILQQVFTDRETMAYIVSHRFDFIHRYILAMNNNPYMNEFKRTTAHELVDALFKTENSILYRQISQYRGSSRALSIYHLLFSNTHILQVSRIFNTNRMYSINKEGVVRIDKYTEALIEAIKSVMDAYLKHPDQNIYYSVFENLRDGIYELLDISQHLAYMGVDKKLLQDINSPEYKAFLAIEMFFGRYGMADSKKQSALLKASRWEREAKREDKYKHSSLQSLMAYGTVEFAKHTCAINYNQDWRLYDVMLTLVDWMEDMTPWSIKHNELFKNYAMEQIGQNLKGYYPVLFSGLICVMAVVHNSIKPANVGLTGLWDELKAILKKELKLAILSDKRMADRTLYKNALIPPNMTVVVDRKRGTVRYYTIDRSGTKSLLKLK